MLFRRIVIVCQLLDALHYVRISELPCVCDKTLAMWCSAPEKEINAKILRSSELWMQSCILQE